MRLAHLILAHTDPQHIQRLIKRLCPFSDVFVHIDAQSDIDSFRDGLHRYSNCYFLLNRLHCEWGGINAVKAEMELVREALKHNDYDRLVLLQGADYPLKSDAEICNYFQMNQNVEFVRACCVTDVKDKYFFDKCRYYLFFNNVNLLKKVINKITYILNIKVRDGYIRSGDEKYKVYWGSAQWALTGKCAKYILSFYNEHPQFNKWFYHAFPADELYVPTVVMNSKFRKNTMHGGPEKPEKGLTNWRNLHYFEYLPGKIKVYTESDYPLLKDRSELYIRKVNSHESSGLLDLLDAGI